MPCIANDSRSTHSVELQRSLNKAGKPETVAPRMMASHQGCEDKPIGKAISCDILFVCRVCAQLPDFASDEDDDTMSGGFEWERAAF
ncbi:MAG: hypothetical protein U0936_05305 [Planctomycetaceae bacterium]